MKSLATVALIAVFAFGPEAAAQTPGIRTVYVMPMAGGLDQHLADRITRDHVYQVVTDPRTADAFLTDRIGSAFEQRMAELFPPVVDDKNKDKDTKEAGLGGHSGLKSTAGKGTIFLVEVKSRQVVWSDFEKAESTPKALDHEADRITKKLAGLSGKGVAGTASR